MVRDDEVLRDPQTDPEATLVGSAKGGNKWTLRFEHSRDLLRAHPDTSIRNGDSQVTALTLNVRSQCDPTIFRRKFEGVRKKVPKNRCEMMRIHTNAHGCRDLISDRDVSRHEV